MQLYIDTANLDEIRQANDLASWTASPPIPPWIARRTSRTPSAWRRSARSSPARSPRRSSPRSTRP